MRLRLAGGLLEELKVDSTLQKREQTVGSSVALRVYNIQPMCSRGRKSSTLEGNGSTGDLSWFPCWQEQVCSHPNVRKKESALSKRKEEHLAISRFPYSGVVC